MRLRPLAPMAALALLAPLSVLAQAPDATLAARNLAATCANCHGTNGQAQGAMQPLAGMPAERMLAMMNAYRNGSAAATVMHQLAKGYSDDQLRLIANHFAAQKPRP
jgi:sulfide dehydrogenase cytochrome subunit